MMRTRRIEIAPGMTFDVSVDGIDAAPLVLMLHGFGVSRFFWNSQVHALGDAGYFAVAPNQRGYAAGARPDPTDYTNYRIDRLIGDALDIVAAVGHGDRRFHLVGHDWGASLAWQIADQHPERLVSLTILSRPHPLAFARALELPDGEHRGDQSTSRDTCANAWTALRSAAQNCSLRSWEGWRPLQVHGSARRWRVRQRCCWWLLISPSMLSQPARHAITPSVCCLGRFGRRLDSA